MQVSAEDRGYLYGDALFETARVVQGEVLWVEHHIARMRRSGAALGFSPARVEEALEALVQAATSGVQRDGLLRVTMSREEGPFGGTGSITLRWRPLPVNVDTRPSLGIERGMYLPGDELSEHKTANYMRSVVAMQRARERGHDDALRVSRDGQIGECAAGNVFLVRGDGVIVTPHIDGVLPGIMREAILGACATHGVEVEQRAVWLDELSHCVEVWVTSMGGGLRSVSEVEGRAFREQARGAQVRGWLVERGWR